MNPLLLQKQLKENANDLQDFYKDLKGWGEEMKRKESSLKQDTSKPQTKKTKGLDSNVVATSGGIQKPERTRITDYAKWDKFDADLECERLEDDFKEDSELSDEFEESGKEEALVHKQKGNMYVQTKQWDKAIECYTKSINCYSYDPIFYANRALCYLKKECFITAEEDCTLALRLDSTYVKALQRRAAARQALGKLELALSDLEIVLTHEPKNKESLVAYEHLKKKLGSVKNVPPVTDESRPVSKFTASRNKFHPVQSVTSRSTNRTAPETKTSHVDTSVPSTSAWPDPGCEIISIKAIKKPPHLRSKKPLKRIEIKEIDSLEPIEKRVSESLLKEPEAFTSQVIEHVRPVQDLEGAGEPAAPVSAFKKSRSKINTITNEAMEKSLPGNNNNSTKDTDLETKEKKIAMENKPKEEKNTENILITKMVKKTVTAPVEDVNAKAINDSSFSTPKTAVQFYTMWKTLKTLDDKYKYLKLIEPQELSKIFRESLESNVFSGILETLSTKYIENGEKIYDVLSELTRVKRFSTLAMFMDSTDKNHLWKLITYLREKEHEKEEVDKLILKYEL